MTIMKWSETHTKYYNRHLKENCFSNMNGNQKPIQVLGFKASIKMYLKFKK